MCGRQGEACCDGGECDSSNVCRKGVCSIPCDKGGRCTAPGAVGACASNGHWSCDAFSRRCIPANPTTETCNGVDDDCDGTVDDIAAPCRAHPEHCHSTFRVDGEMRCVARQATCVATEASCPYHSQANCGTPGFTPCRPDGCFPGFACVRDPDRNLNLCTLNRNCPHEPPPDACWRETDVGHPCWEP
jgi:hypothetical protein